ncbi:MBL fold metallo-hydrolase [Candidatus Parcubacteria bacterium]|nr:MAG: MBL fold metallo-hydrolase [Candidatus Parcubacteria bacterium]
MKALLWLVGAIIVAALAFYFLTDMSTPESAFEQQNTMQQQNLPMVTPIEHATMILDWGGTILYTDPVGDASAFAGKPAANIVVVTDIHGDHFSTSTLAAVVGPNTALIVPQAVMDQLPAELASRATVMNNGQTRTEQGIEISAIPMYNLPESADSRHTKGRGNGYVMEKDGARVYVAGDTAGIPEMRALTDIDMAFVPMNLPYTMSVEEAADAVLDFAPARAYPYHYRSPDGLADVEKFKQLVNAGNPDIEVVLLDWYSNQ